MTLKLNVKVFAHRYGEISFMAYRMWREILLNFNRGELFGTKIAYGVSITKKGYRALLCHWVKYTYLWNQSSGSKHNLIL